MDTGDLNNMENNSIEKSSTGGEVAIYESIRRDLTTGATKINVPLSYVFGRGLIGDKDSFGGSTLNENSAKVDQALANVEELQSIWNHSHTQWTWRHLNLSYHSPIRNMRQVAAEMASKKAALSEAKWRQVESEMKMRKIEEELNRGLEEGTIDYWREVDLKIKLAKMKEGASTGTLYIEGAMKDVLALNDLYEQLKAKVTGFSEHDVEKEETKSHLQRSLVQCIRDVRERGAISKGEQEYIEQIGVNPMKLQGLLQKYVASEAEEDNWSVSGLYEFVDKLTDELADVYKVDHKRMELQGFNPEPVADYSYINKVALLSNNNKEE
jgi:hypothetical protein